MPASVSIYSPLLTCFLSVAWPIVKSAGMKRGQGYWRSIENRKKFFIDYAKQMGFDPNNPWNWQRVTKAHIVASKVNISFLPYLGFSFFLKKKIFLD